MTQLPSVCIVGAGSSGIAAAKALHQRAIPMRSRAFALPVPPWAQTGTVEAAR
jgi:NADH dehydrogenase FAD-containing subunit